jgi:hypothetical protein
MRSFIILRYHCDQTNEGEAGEARSSSSWWKDGKCLVRSCEVKQHFGRLTHRLRGNMILKWMLEELSRWVGVDWINVAEDRHHCRAV